VRWGLLCSPKKCAKVHLNF